MLGTVDVVVAHLDQKYGNVLQCAGGLQNPTFVPWRQSYVTITGRARKHIVP